MNDRYDALIVGGRCAGSSAAISLARAGYRVLLLERRAMPSDTLSTHVLWPDGAAALADLGVLDRVLETGVPKVRHFRLFRGDDVVATTLEPYRGYDYFLCVRRQHLDGILFKAAAETDGVDVLDRCRLTGLIRDGERVVGGTLLYDGEEREIRADLVVGADGKDSTVAQLVAASEYDIVDAGRYWYYAYFTNVDEPEPLAMTESDTETDTVVSMRTNDNQHMVIYGAYREDYDEFRKDHQTNYLERVRQHPVMNRMLANAELASPVYGIAGIRGYYRESAGPGWVLAGDAAHLKDPIVARGISDALRGGIDLGEKLSAGLAVEALDAYAAGIRDRTRASARMAAMLSRPDRHMSADQAGVLVNETSSPEGLTRILGIEYGVVCFDDLFMTGRDGVVEVPAKR